MPAQPHAPGLPLTGERTVPGIVEENYWFRVAVALCSPWLSLVAV
ncbi:hypothetical protein [Actinokineospora enzanensis]|nr:hypothetical protein [Actinokineospora enzanensis]